MESVIRNRKEKKMTIIYPVIFTATHDKKDTYLVDIPDIDGATEGYGLEDAYRMARDYIGCTLYDKPDNLIPDASDISKIKVKKGKFADAGDSFVSLVDLDIDLYRRKMNKRSVRRNVSIPAWLNQAADDAHINVSRVLQDALMEKLGVL